MLLQDNVIFCSLLIFLIFNGLHGNDVLDRIFRSHFVITNLAHTYGGIGSCEHGLT